MRTKIKKSRRYKKRQNKRTLKNKLKKMRGGLSQNNWQTCPNANVSCNWFDKHYTNNKQNQTWDTCINMNGIYNHIIYITSQNVLIKSIESLQIPEFKVKLPTENQPISCKIMIDDKYIGCFLNICGKWYVIMRLFGKTVNTGMLARTEINKAYYEISNIDIDAENPDIGTSIITIPKESYTEVNDSTILSTSNTKIIQLNNNSFININKENDVFYVLQRFRQEKIWANAEKEEVASNIAKNLFLGFFQY